MSSVETYHIEVCLMTQRYLHYSNLTRKQLGVHSVD